MNFYTKKIFDEINKINPDLIVTHSQNDYHPDHRALSRMVKSVAGIYYPVLFADNFVGIDFKPNYYIDITKFFKKNKLYKAMHLNFLKNILSLLKFGIVFVQFSAMV